MYILILLKACLKPRRSDVLPAEESVATAARDTRVHQRKMNMSYLLFSSFLSYCAFFLCRSVIARFFPDSILQYPMLLQWMSFLHTCGYAVHSVSWCMHMDSYFDRNLVNGDKYRPHVQGVVKTATCFVIHRPRFSWSR